MDPLKETAIQKGKEYIAALDALGPDPSALPGPDQTEAGKAFQARSLAVDSLSWLEE